MSASASEWRQTLRCCVVVCRCWCCIENPRDVSVTSFLVAARFQRHIFTCRVVEATKPASHKTIYFPLHPSENKWGQSREEDYPFNF